MPNYKTSRIAEVKHASKVDNPSITSDLLVLETPSGENIDFSGGGSGLWKAGIALAGPLEDNNGFDYRQDVFFVGAETPADFSGTADTIEGFGTVSAGPLTLAAGQGLALYLIIPHHSAGTVTLAEVQVSMSNAVGTQKVTLSTIPLSVLPAGSKDVTTLAGWSVVEQIGADLSADGTFKSTAGGQFFASMYAHFSGANLVA